MCWAHLYPRLAQHALSFEHFAVIAVVLSAFFALLATGLLRRFLRPILDIDSLSTRNCNLSTRGLFPKPWFQHSCFGLNQIHGLHKNKCVAWKPRYTQKPWYAVCTKKCFTSKTVFPRQVLVLFVACRTSRRRPLNFACSQNFEVTNLI